MGYCLDRLFSPGFAIESIKLGGPRQTQTGQFPKFTDQLPLLRRRFLKRPQLPKSDHTVKIYTTCLNNSHEPRLRASASETRLMRIIETGSIYFDCMVALR